MNFFLAQQDFKQLPFELYCPPGQKYLMERTCKVCSVYFTPKAQLYIRRALFLQLQE